METKIDHIEYTFNLKLMDINTLSANVYELQSDDVLFCLFAIFHESNKKSRKLRENEQFI